MSDKSVNTTKSNTPTNAFWQKNKSKIIIIVSFLAMLTIAYFVYTAWNKSKEDSANEAAFMSIRVYDGMANNGYNKDSIDLILKGGNFDGSKIPGLLDFMKKYGSTDQGNIANYVLGCCYLNTKNYDEAIKYLKAFKDNDALQLKSRTLKLLGDAYAEKNQLSEATSHYKQAIDASPKDEVMTANAIYHFALFCESNNNSADALANFKKLRDEYPNYEFVLSKDVEKHLARMGEMN